MKLLLLLVLSILLKLPSAQAFSVGPDVVELTPTGKGSTATVMVFNPGNEDIALAVYMKTRSYDEFAVETKKEFDVKKNFLILPANTTVKAHTSAAIRFVYIGSKENKGEQAYRAIFANLSPKTLLKSGGAAKTEITALFSYEISVYVGPTGLKPALKFNGIVKKAGKSYFAIENTGTKRVRLALDKIKIRAANLKAAEEFEGGAFKGLEVPIMPGQVRLAEFPSASKADKDSAKIDLSDWH
jgi:P pilus assembly chaperone PapD